MNKYNTGILVCGDVGHGRKNLVDTKDNPIYVGRTCDVQPITTEKFQQQFRDGLCPNQMTQFLVRLHGQRDWNIFHKSWVWVPAERSYSEHYDLFGGKNSGLFVS